MEGPTHTEKIKLERAHTFWKKIAPSLKWILVIALGTGIGNVISFPALDWYSNNQSQESSINNEQNNNVISSNSATCNIAVIPIDSGISTVTDEGFWGMEGDYYTSADDVVDVIVEAEKENRIEGIMLRIDSGGGTPVASEIIAEAVKNAKKPVVALIREVGNSGAYLVASAADTIIASPMSDVGSIGVTMSYLANVEENVKNGKQFIELVAGKFKEVGNPDRPLSNEERALFQRDLNIVYNQMVEEISKNRNMPIEKVQQLADGSSMPGTLALENGLIDELGGQEAVHTWFAKELDKNNDEIEFCKPVWSIPDEE
jgi:protease-4